MRRIILMFICNIWFLSAVEIKYTSNQKKLNTSQEVSEITFKIIYFDVVNTYECDSGGVKIINEHDLISITADVGAKLTPQSCYDSKNVSNIIFKKQSKSKLNTETRFKEQSDVISATLSMSTKWICGVYWKSKMFFCEIQVHVRSSNIGFLSSRTAIISVISGSHVICKKSKHITDLADNKFKDHVEQILLSKAIPIIDVNENELIVKQLTLPVTEYDAETVYNFVDGELLVISCIYTEPAGMKFVYSGLEIDDNDKPNDFIYEYSVVYTWVKMKSSHNNSYIDCVVKRNEHRNVVVRLHLVLKDELVNSGSVKITINDKELNTRKPNVPVTDYDAETEYNFVDGEFIRIGCIYTEATGVKFVYNGFGIGENDTYQPTDFIYERRSIHSSIRLRRSNDNSYIDCVIKRKGYRNAVVRIHFVLKQELVTNVIADDLIVRVDGVILTPRTTPHNVYTYVFKPRDIMNISCETRSGAYRNLKIQFSPYMEIIGLTTTSNIVNKVVDMTKYNTRKDKLYAECTILNSNTAVRVILIDAKVEDVTVYGLKTSNVLLKFRNEIDVDVVLYEYEDGESLNLTWFLRTKGETIGNVRITWKGTVLENTTLNTSMPEVVASQVFSLSAGDNWTIIHFLVKEQLHWIEKYWIVLLSKSPPSSSNQNYGRSISIRTPIMKINDGQLNAIQSNVSAADYETVIRYSFVDGELLRISCHYNEAAGMKFVYSGFGIDDTYQRTGFIYKDTSIYSRVKMKSTYNNSCIDCVVKRNEYRNVVVRLHLVLKDELENKDELIVRINGVILTPRKTPHNVCTYVYMTREMINISCETRSGVNRNLTLDYNPEMKTNGLVVTSNVVSSVIDMKEYIYVRNIQFYAECSIINSKTKAIVILNKAIDNDVTVYGLKTSNVLLKFRNEIDVDVILYEYQNGETLNLTWFLKTKGETTGNVRITWKGTVLENSVFNMSTSGIVAAHFFTLAAEDNRSVISCIVRKQWYWVKELRIVLFSQPEPFTDQSSSGLLSTGTFLLIGLSCVVCLAFIIATLLIIRKVRGRTMASLSETELSNCETTDDRVNRQFPKQLDDYVRSMQTGGYETTAATSNNPASLYSVPMPKSKRMQKNNKSLYANVNEPNAKMDTKKGVRYINAGSGIDGKNYKRNVNDGSERYVNVNNDKDIEMELYCDINLK